MYTLCSLLFLPLGQCICSALVPSGGAISTSDTRLPEEGTGQGARDHRASASPEFVYLWVMTSGKGALLESGINMLLLGFLNPALSVALSNVDSRGQHSTFLLLLP